MQITAEGEYSTLCTYLETLLTMVWYPTTVATLSRRARDVVEQAFARTSDQGADSPLVESRLQVRTQAKQEPHAALRGCCRRGGGCCCR